MPFLLLALSLFLMIPARPILAAPREEIRLTADRLEYLKEKDLFLAEGSVVIQQDTTEIKADSIRLDHTLGKLRAAGNVYFTDGENLAESVEAKFDINTKLGVLNKGRLFIKSDNYYLRGKRIERSALDRYELHDGSFTACKCEDDPAWIIRTQHLRITLDKYVVAKNVVFYARNVPIFYLPYLIYPVKTTRQTGLLVPRAGYSSRYGFRYQQNLFWAISKSKDATFSLEHRGSKGDGLAIEYRYLLSSESRGTLYGDYFLDRENNIARWEVRYALQHRFTNRIEARLDARHINKVTHFQDLSDQTFERALQEVESNFILAYQGDESYAYLLGRYTQNLTTTTNSTTLQRLPEIGYTLNEHRIGTAPIFFHFESTAVNFWRQTGLSAKRVDVYPKISLPVSIPYLGILTPWAGFRETWYSRGILKDHSISHEIIPSGIKLENLFSRHGETFTHMISPTIFYEYIEVEDKGDIPQFDEVDRIANRNAITVSISQRFLTTSRGGRLEEIGSLRLTETYRIDTARSDFPDSRPYSDLHGELTLNPFPSVSLSFDSFYNLHDSHLSSFNSDLQFKLKPYVNLALGQRSTRAGSIPKKGDLFNPLYLRNTEDVPSDISFWTGSVLVRSPWGFGAGNRTYFDADAKELVEIDYEIFYEAECWGIVLTYLDFKDRDEFTFSITLKGLGKMKSRLFNNLFTSNMGN
ncbi:MAG: LPS assembly protein LptD [Nitrospira sp.]